MNRRTFEEMVSYFNQTVADMDIDRKYKIELLGMITAILQRHDEDMKHAPTIEPKKGKWNCSDDYYETGVCSVCEWDTGESYVNCKKWFKYCPICGADMRG